MSISRERVLAAAIGAVIFGVLGPAIIGLISVPVLAIAAVIESATTGRALTMEFAKACLLLLVVAPFLAYMNGGFVALSITGLAAGYCRRHSQSKLYVPVLAFVGAALSLVLYHLMNRITWDFVAHPTVRFVVNDLVHMVVPSACGSAFLAWFLHVLDAKPRSVISTT